MKLGHVHLKVRGLAQAERFYCDVLGLVVKERVAGHFLFLTFGDAHHDIALQEVGGDWAQSDKRAPNSPGLYHSAFEVKDARELLAVIERLRQRSCPFSMVDHKISWAVYTEDPSGNGVEVYLDRRAVSGDDCVWGGESFCLTEDDIKAVS